jgi:hypothetical protein
MAKIYSGCASLPAGRIKSGCGFPCADVPRPAESSSAIGSSLPSKGIIFRLMGIIFRLPELKRLQFACGKPGNKTISDTTMMFRRLSYDDHPKQLQSCSNW